MPNLKTEILHTATDMEFGNKYDELEDTVFGYADGYGDEDYSDYCDDSDDGFSAFLEDIDFSEIRGNDFRKNLKSVNRQLQTKVVAPNAKVVVEGKGRGLNAKLPRSGQRIIAPAGRDVVIEGRQKPRKPVTEAQKRSVPKMMRSARPIAPQQTKLPVGGKVNIKGKPQKISKVIVPDDKKVIVQGVSDFILSQGSKVDSIKNVGYYKGKRLEELVLTFNNNTPLPFVLELFNPSMPLDYLYSTSLNINNKIEVGGGQISYTDVLFNILANSTMIPNAQFVFSGASVNQQRVIPIRVKNKSITGEQKIYPFNLDLKVDNMQVASDIVYFDFFQSINRPYIPDGMDVIEYTILPNMVVTMAFYYDQINLKKLLRPEARYDKGLM